MDRPHELPPQFGRYRLLKQLGAGGMGRVYLAHDAQLNRQVALKVPFLDAGRDALERFYREARAAATLNHPSLCPIHDIGQVNGIPYLTMAYIEGQTLAALINPDKPWTTTQAAGLIRKLALALEEAHRRGVIHRDLKPSNIIINQRREPIVLDFGLARYDEPAQKRLTRLGTPLGTPAYMSPEQIAGDSQKQGPACDVYSLGVILYELITGTPPFGGPTLAILGQVVAMQPEAPARRNPGVDPRLATVCLRAMAKKPEERYASMGDFAAALAEFLRAPAPPPATAPLAILVPDEAAPPRPRRSRLVAAGGALLSLLVLGVFVFRSGTKPPAPIDPPGIVGDERSNEEELPAPLAPFRVGVNGLGGQTHVEPITFGDDFRGRNGRGNTAPWTRDGAVADLTTRGCLGYPPLRATTYVMEVDLTPHLKAPGEEMRLCVGDPDLALHLQLFWNAEKRVVMPRLQRWRDGVWYYFGVETSLQTGQRVRLKLVVLEGLAMLLWRGRVIQRLDQVYPTDLCLRIWSKSNRSATIHRLAFRAVRATDLAEEDWALPGYQLELKPREAEQRLANLRTRLSSSPEATKPFVVESLGTPMSWIEPGEYERGSRDPNDIHRHRVQLTRGFWMGRHEVTQGEFEKILGRNPSRFSGSPYLPVDSVTYADAVEFCRVLTTTERLPIGLEYRLPTEAEWEYACRAGTETPFAVEEADVWSLERSRGRPREVAAGAANRWGLFDMHGNVQEWVADHWSDYPQKAQAALVDPLAVERHTWMVVRGGSFWLPAEECASHARERNLAAPANGYRGFRLVLGAPLKR